MINKYYEAIEFLKTSAIFAMSLGSKELFHSNFWAFLMEDEETKDFIHVFFPMFDTSLEYEVLRENENRDITIKNNQGIFVIENKIKSYGNYDQLVNYECTSGILTGIKFPPFELPKKWNFVSYEKVAEGLKNLLLNPKCNNRNIIEEYVKVLESINIIMSFALNESKNQLSFWSNDVALLNDKKIRMLDVYRKLKADDYVINGFGNKNIERFENITKDNPRLKFNVSRSFNNCKATITFEFLLFSKDKNDSNDKVLESIGVQIEDNQFRLFKWNDDMTGENIFKKYCHLKWFDESYSRNHKFVHKYRSKMRNPYCKYGKNWIYQYFLTYFDNVENLQSYDFITQLIVNYLEKAFDIISNN